MKCIFLSFQPFLDVVGGGGQTLASAAMLQAVSRQIDVELVYLSPHADLVQTRDRIGTKFPRVKNVRVFKYRADTPPGRRAAFAARLLPASLAALEKSNARQIVAEVHSVSSPDVVHYDLMPWMYFHPVGRGRARPTVCSGHDAYSLAYRRKIRFEADPAAKLRDWVSALAFSRFEGEYLPRAECVHMVSCDDVAHLRDRGVKAVFRQANIPLEDVWFEAPHSPAAHDFGRRLLLSGSVAQPWYWTGVLAFLRNIWPRVGAAFPDARLTIQSKDAVPLPSDLAHPGRVSIVGRVDDFRRLFQSYDYFVHPVLAGTGQKNRLAVAMAQGLCCFASEMAVSGMGLHAEDDYVPLHDVSIGDADAVASVLASRGRTAEIARSGRSRMLAEFSLEAVGRRLLDIYDEAIRGLATRRSE